MTWENDGIDLPPFTLHGSLLLKARELTRALDHVLVEDGKLRKEIRRQNHIIVSFFTACDRLEADGIITRDVLNEYLRKALGEVEDGRDQTEE